MQKTEEIAKLLSRQEGSGTNINAQRKSKTCAKRQKRGRGLKQLRGYKKRRPQERKIWVIESCGARGEMEKNRRTQEEGNSKGEKSGETYKTR